MGHLSVSKEFRRLKAEVGDELTAGGIAHRR
jgi:hypothetical protein